MRPRAWLFGFSHSSAIAQITVRASEFCFSLCEGQFLCVPWHETVFCVSKKCPYFIKNEL